jgi:hypothetical protein
LDLARLVRATEQYLLEHESPLASEQRH